MTIGEFAKQSGITADLLRHYEQLGLLLPTRLANGYRQYTVNQLEIAKQIKILRQLDMPLLEIKKLLEGKNPKLLELHEARLQQRLLEGRDALLMMRWLLLGKRHHKPLEVCTRQLPKSHILSLRQSVSWRDIDVFTERAKRAFNHLLQAQQTRVMGEVLVLQHNLGLVIDHLDLEVQLPVSAAMYGGNGVLAGERPANTVMLTPHQGNPRQALPLYRQLHHQLEASGVQFGTAIWLPTHLGYMTQAR